MTRELPAAPGGYWAALERGAWFALPDVGAIRLSGPDAEGFLERLLSLEVAGLAEGGSAPACLMDPNGNLLATLDVHRTEPRTHVLVVPGDRLGVLHEKLSLYHLNEALELERVETTWRGVVGPEAEAVASAAGTALPWSRAGGAPTGPAWVVGPDTRLEGVEEGCAEARECLRVESGVAGWGREIDDHTTPIEIDMADAVVTTKCYPGQETVARTINLGRPARTLVGLEGLADPGAEGTDLFDGERRVGRVTSAAFSPRLGEVHGLAMVRTKRAAPGGVLALAEPGGASVTVTAPAVPLA